jgi:hypothetical protein
MLIPKDFSRGKRPIPCPKKRSKWQQQALIIC